jgi:hypothetical protein
MTFSELDAGPRVATILARREEDDSVWLIRGSIRGTPEGFPDCIRQEFLVG